MGDSPRRDTAPTVAERRGSAPRVETVEAKPTAASAPARELAGDRYRLRDEIARGGMGRVVEATDTVLDRVVAVKEALSTDEEALRRFARETRITARLEHPCIVPVHDAGVSADGAPYYVMRKVSGKPLAALISGAATIDARLALLPHVVAAAHAVAHAHGRGIVHRDLKPTNILVGDNGETVVIDWGLAKVVGEPDDLDPHGGAASAASDAGGSLRTRIGTVFGTPGFMAPEQVRGERVDARGDVYALGATLYYALAREPPHARESEDEMLAAAAAGPPTPIAELVAGVPAELSTIVDKALAFDDRARYADASALAEDLQRFLTGQLVASHRYSRRERLVRFVRRNRVPVAIAALATVAIGVVGSIAIARVVAERDRADEQRALAVQHAREAELRADDLLVEQASALVDTNPTAAVALVKQLRTPADRWQRMWRRARAVAAGARGRGVARAVRGPERLFMLAMSPKGKRFVASGTDGETWLYDATGASRVLANAPQRRVALFVDDDHLIVFPQAEPALLHDLVAGTSRVVPAVIDARLAEIAPGALYWTGQDERVRRTDLRDGATQVLHGDIVVHEIATSPDQRWVAMVGDHAVTLLDLSVPGAPPRAFAVTEQVILAAWRGDSQQLAITSVHGVGLLAPTASAIEWRPTPASAMTPGFAGQFPAFGGMGLYVWSDGNFVLKIDRIDLGAGLNQVDADAIAVLAGNVVHVLDGRRDLPLVAPNESVVRLASAPKSPYLIGGTTGRVLIWNVHDTLARSASWYGLSTVVAIGDHDCLVEYPDSSWWWIDTNTNERSRVRDIPPVVAYDASTADRVIVHDVAGTHHAFVIRRDHARITVDRFEQGTREAVFDDDGAAIIATERGPIVRFDPDTRVSSTLVSRARPAESIVARGSWIVASYEDGLVVRLDRRNGRQDEMTIPTRKHEVVALLPDGRACFAADKAVRCWRVDGVLDALALPEDGHVIMSSGYRILVTTPALSAYIADIEHGQVTSTLPPNAFVSIAERAQLAAYETGKGGVDMVDLVDGSHWSFVAGGAARIVRPTLSNDGTRLFGMADGTMWIWELDLPADAAATARWLDALTNATAEHGPRTLTWN